MQRIKNFLKQTVVTNIENIITKNLQTNHVSLPISKISNILCRLQFSPMEGWPSYASLARFLEKVLFDSNWIPRSTTKVICLRTNICP